MSKRRIDWQQIRERFVCGGHEVTHAVLAAEFKCARETITRRASKEGWAAQRSQYRHQVVTRSRGKASTLAAEHLARQLEDAETVRVLARKALAHLQTPQRVKQLNVRDCRLLLLAAARIENQALGVEGEVNVRVVAEFETKLRLLLPALGDEVYNKVLDVLALPDSGETQS